LRTAHPAFDGELVVTESPGLLGLAWRSGHHTAALRVDLPARRATIDVSPAAPFASG